MGLAALSFALASLLPVYTDEITWSAILGRMNFDHGRSLTVTLQPACEGFYAHRVAAVMWWPRWLSTLFAEPLKTPLLMRLSGVFQALLWIAITVRLLQRLVPRSRLLLAGVVAWSTLGVQPFLLVLNRPEQVLLAGTTVLLLLGLAPPDHVRSARAETATALAFLCGCWYVFAAHPSGVFVAPLALLCAWRISTRGAARWALVAGIATVALMVFRAWQPLWGCTRDPAFARLMITGNFGNAHAIGMDAAFWTYQKTSLKHTSGWFLRAFVPKNSYCSNMIPPFVFPHAQLLRDSIELVCLVLLAAGFLCFARVAVRSLTRGRNISLVLLLGSGWMIYFLNVLVRAQKNEYEAAYIEPLIGILIFSSVWAYWKAAEPADDRLPRMAVSAVMLLSVVSQVCLLGAYGPVARSLWLRGGQPPGQKFSVSVAHDQDVTNQIRLVAKECSIPTKRELRHMIVDESSYFVFRDSTEPLFAGYFDDRGWARNQPDSTALFRAMHSDGLVTYCDRVPTAYMARAKRRGDVCCLPAFHN